MSKKIVILNLRKVQKKRETRLRNFSLTVWISMAARAALGAKAAGNALVSKEMIWIKFIRQ